MVVPQQLVDLLQLFVAFLVVQGLKEVLVWTGIDLTGNATKITAALVLAVVTFANNWLAMVPAQYVPLVQALFGVLVAILGLYGVARTYQGLKGEASQV